MKYNYRGINIYIYEDYESISKKAALLLASQVTLNPKSVLGLATGSTPIGMYKRLVEMYNNDIVDFSEVVTFNLDEYYPIDANNPQSYAYFMNNNFFDHININRDNINIPSGTVQNINEYCESYDNKIFQYDKIDFQVLGIGINGHIGFNEPDVHFEAGTHLVQLDDETIKANSRFFEKEEDVPREAISIGIRNIMQSKKIILLASGENKADAVYDMIFGDVTPNLPASILQVHSDIHVLLDKNSAKKVITKLDNKYQIGMTNHK